MDTDANTAEICRKQTTRTSQINNGKQQSIPLECPTDLSKSYLPPGLGVFLDIQSTDFSAVQKQDDSSTSDDDDDDADDDDAADDINGNNSFEDDKFATISCDPNVGAENLKILTNGDDIHNDEKKKLSSINSEKVVEEDASEEGKEGLEEKKTGQPQKTSRKKRKRKNRKSRKRRAKPPQLQETLSSETCAMTTQTKTSVVSATRPLSLPLSLGLPLTLPIRPLSLSPLHDGPIKATTPDSTRSLYPMPTLAVINEYESIDDESLNSNEIQKRGEVDSVKDKQKSPESPKISTSSPILNHNIHSRIIRSLNDNNIIPNDNINNNTTNNNDNNNNKNNLCKIITNDFNKINADYNYDCVDGDNNDSHVEFKNKYFNNNTRLSANFSDLYRLESSAKSNAGDINASPGLEGVKAMANRLNLATRRPSYQLWRDRYFGSGGVPRFPDLSPEDPTGEILTDERKGRINSALEWIKNELGQMRTVDHNLATQLLTLRNEINRLKLERSCESHQDLLDDVKDELSDRETLSAVSDIPYDMADDNPLKHLGVTRMNISSRRFSMC